MTFPDIPEPEFCPTIRRYWSDPVFAARLDAEMQAHRDAFWSIQDAQRRADQEKLWAAEREDEDDLNNSLEAL